MRFRTNVLYKQALELSTQIIDEQNQSTINQTKTFFEELEKIIKAGELISININGQVTKGKSTVAITLCQQIIHLCNKHYKTKQTMSIHNICRDQNEYSKTMRNPKIHHTCLTIDEWNELEESTENATIENKLLNHFSDVQAQRYIHKISCSPKESTDKNADIYLEVIQADKKNKITHCWIYYQIYKNGQEQRILLGYVNINVAHTLKQRYYQEYIKRKFEKMDLIIKEGIFIPRKLDYADIIQETTQKLKALSQTGILTKEIINNYVRMISRHKKIPLTIIGLQSLTNDIYANLTLYRQYVILQQKLKKERNPDKIPTLQNALNDLGNAILTQEEELTKNLTIKNKYDKEEQT